jgi:universal stress protein A
MLKPTKILVPTDFSESSDKALRQGLDIAKQYKAKLYLLHVIHEEMHQCALDFCIGEELIRQIKDQINTAARENLEKQLDRMGDRASAEVTIDVKEGVPYEAILQEEKERGIDLIVIASLGKTGLAKYIIGSVARNVLKGAKCPVLLTK